MKRVLLVKAGDVQPPLSVSHGDYDRWFQRALGGACRLEVVQAHRGERLPDPTAYDAVMTTGSPLSATVPEPWMRAAADYLVEAAERRRPVLGVCFGHQLLGLALGSRVIKNPRGRETGTVEVRLTPEGRADPLFAGLPESFFVQATHEDIVEVLPNGAVALAGNESTALQALAFGERIRGVQFHPELDAATMSALIESRRARLGARVPELLAGVRSTALAERILLNLLAF